MSTLISFAILSGIIVWQFWRIGKTESQFIKIYAAIQKACDNAKPEDKNEVLDQLIKDLWYALYK